MKEIRWTAKYQVIKHEGKPLFVLVPYDEFLKFMGQEEEPTIPHEVVGLVVKRAVTTAPKPWKNWPEPWA